MDNERRQEVFLWACVFHSPNSRCFYWYTCMWLFLFARSSLPTCVLQLQILFWLTQIVKDASLIAKEPERILAFHFCLYYNKNFSFLFFKVSRKKCKNKRNNFIDHQQPLTTTPEKINENKSSRFGFCSCFFGQRSTAESSHLAFKVPAG